jgi:hypothetical protein
LNSKCDKASIESTLEFAAPYINDQDFPKTYYLFDQLLSKLMWKKCEVKDEEIYFSMKDIIAELFMNDEFLYSYDYAIDNSIHIQHFKNTESFKKDFQESNNKDSLPLMGMHYDDVN